MPALNSEMMSLPGGPALVQWRRSARALRVSLRIDPCGGAVVVTLPPRAARTAGMALLVNHAGWVAARLAALPGPVAFSDGALVPLHGLDHRIRHIPEMRGQVQVADREIHVFGDAALLARRVAEFFRTEARQRFLELVSRKVALGHTKPARVVVKDTRSRWGSCTSSGTLAFSWRLIMAPAFVQDYVAAHEVAHLKHMNHGPRFWGLVSQLTPHTTPAMAWLRSNGPKLLRVG